MSTFKDVFINELIKDYKLNPCEYVKSLDRTIEIEVDRLLNGITRKDGNVLINACREYGIGNNYHEIKKALGEFSSIK